MYEIKYADRSYYTQRNNPIDVYNKIIGKESYLESCMEGAVTNACVSLLTVEPQFYITRTIPGHNTIKFINVPVQPEQVGWELLNDPNNWPELQKYRKISEPEIYGEGIVMSRVPQYIPFLTDKLFNLKSKFHWVEQSGLFNILADNIIKGIPGIICFSDPGHYVAVLKYDPADDVLYYNDSAYGKDIMLSREEVADNTECYYVEVYPKVE